MDHNPDDGQEGIFFLNWAKGYIDLRIFHFLGLHALQPILLFAWFFAKENAGFNTALYFSCYEYALGGDFLTR